MNKFQGFIFKNELTAFFILTFIISWTLWLISGVLQSDYTFCYDNHWLISQIGVFGPALATMILALVQKNNWWLILLIIISSTFLLGVYIASISKESIIQLNLTPKILLVILAAGLIFCLFRKHQTMLKKATIKLPGDAVLKWLLLSILIMPVAFTALWFVMHPSGVIKDVSLFNGKPTEIALAVILIFSINFIFGGSLGEEIGWRGFALPKLLKKYNPLKASIILAIIWALWHLPIDIVNGSTAVIFRFIWTIPLTIVFTWFFIRTKGSLLIAMLLHTSINILPDLGFSNYENSIIGLFLFIVALSLFIIFIDKLWEKIPFNKIIINI